MAIALHNLGDDARARKEMERVTREQPGHANAWFNLGVVAGSMGDKKTAIRAWEQYLKLDPSGERSAGIREELRRLKGTL
jgi:predicted TPR repeat methyltransferase